jgi:hypothetical protein
MQTPQQHNTRLWYAEMHAYALGAAANGVHHMASKSSIFHVSFYHPHGVPPQLSPIQSKNCCMSAEQYPNRGYRPSRLLEAGSQGNHDFKGAICRCSKRPALRLGSPSSWPALVLQQARAHRLCGREVPSLEPGLWQGGPASPSPLCPTP